MTKANGKIQGHKDHSDWAKHSGAEKRSLFWVRDTLLRTRLNAALLLAMTGVTVALMSAGAQTPTESADKYVWLEDVSSERSMAWVKAENERSAKVLESDPHFAGL